MMMVQSKSLATLFLVFGLCFSLEAHAADKIRIGISSALSGNAAAYGTDVKDAIVFANEQLGADGYELIIEDDQCLDREAVTVASKLVNVSKVSYVLGFGCSGSALAAAPVYERAKVIVIASGAGAPAISQAGDYIFRTKPSLTIAAELLAQDMAAKFKRVGVISEETVYCQGLTSSFTKEAERLGLSVESHNFAPHTDDFRSVLLRLKSHGVEAIFLNPQAEPTITTMYKQLRELGFKGQVYGNFHPGSPTFLNAFGSSADGVIFTDLAFNDQYLNSKGLELVAKYEQKYGKPKSGEHFVSLSMLAFDALHQAIKSGKDVKEYLYTHSFGDLVEGGFSFDRNGDIVSPRATYALKTIKNGVPARLPGK